MYSVKAPAVKLRPGQHLLVCRGGTGVTSEVSAPVSAVRRYPDAIFVTVTHGGVEHFFVFGPRDDVRLVISNPLQAAV